MRKKDVIVKGASKSMASEQMVQTEGMLPYILRRQAKSLSGLDNHFEGEEGLSDIYNSEQSVILPKI